MLFGIPWQIIILFSGALSAIGQSFGKNQVNKFGAFQVGFWRDTATLVIAGLFLISIGFAHMQYFWIVFVYGLVMSFTVAAYLAAIRDDFSGATVFSYSISQILIILFSSVLFGEWIYFSPLTIQGRGNILAVVLMIASFMLYRGGFRILRKWDKMLFLAIIMNVFGVLFAKHMLGNLRMSIYEFLVYQNIGMLAGSAFFVLRKKQTVLLGGRNILMGLAQGVFVTAGVMIYLTIIKDIAPLSLASMTRRVATVLLTAGSGLFLFKEHKALDKKTGWSLVLGLAVFVLILVVN